MNLIFLLSIITLSFVSASSKFDIPPPYNEIELLPFNSHGGHNNCEQIEKLIKTNNIQVIVEVGSCLGESTRLIAQALPENGIVYAIDRWEEPSEECDFNCLKTSNTYRQFLSNVIHANLTHKIVPIKMSSHRAAKILLIKPDLIYINESHDFESVYNHLTDWFPFVKEGGILCGNDYFSDPVKQAIYLFATTNNFVVYNFGPFWCSRKRPPVASKFLRKR